MLTTEIWERRVYRQISLFCFCTVVQHCYISPIRFVNIIKNRYIAWCLQLQCVSEGAVFFWLLILVVCCSSAEHTIRGQALVLWALHPGVCQYLSHPHETPAAPALLWPAPQGRSTPGLLAQSRPFSLLQRPAAHVSTTSEVAWGALMIGVTQCFGRDYNTNYSSNNMLVIVVYYYSYYSAMTPV